MELVLEFLGEVFLSFIAEGLLALCELFVPKKVIEKRGRKVINWVCIIVSITLIIGLIIGIIILNEINGRNFLGWLLISLNILFFALGIVFKIIAHVKKKCVSKKGVQNEK